MVTTRQKPSVEPRPAANTIIGWARKKTKLHQAACSPTYCFAIWKNGQRPVAKTARDRTLAQPYHIEWLNLNTRPAAACQRGNSSATGASLALKPTMIG